MSGFEDFLSDLFSLKTWDVIWPAILDTLVMTSVSTILMAIFGLALGTVLLVTRPGGLRPLRVFNVIFGGIIDALRSLPSMVIIILTLPLAKIIIGRSWGPGAVMIALALTCTPMFARMVESSFLEVARGKIEAAKSIGARNWEILLKVILPESLPGLIRAFTIAIIALISVTAIAGWFGGGGLGDVAVRYGYTRFLTHMLVAAVAVLIIIVEFVQVGGEAWAKHIVRKRHL
ncbi:MAG: ABC transporter permease [Coriobacteriales bacterium]|jgi:D-methionine transport system permease protein|nr:ABC transporter permease [Coriobacteriales bacterium]